MPLISIITPSFNQAAYLEQTLRSVLEQDYEDKEYLVVDGGSTDGSLDILKRYASRLAWWVSEKDEGQAQAINKGAAHSKGDILAWLNSDDYYLPGTLRAAAQAFEIHPEVVMLYGDMLAVDELGRTTNTFKYKPLTLADLLCFQIIGQPAVFMRRSAFEKAGGLDTRFHFLLDHQLWIKLAAQGPSLHIDQTWAAARYHAEAKNRLKAAEFGREAFQILDWAAQEPELETALAPVRRRALACAHRVDARYRLDGGQPGPALREWLHALLIHPPTALSRMNLLGSALLNLSGLGFLRESVLRRRRERLSS